MRVALIADTHLPRRSPECVANGYAAQQVAERLSPHLTVNLGDITPDGQSRAGELAYAAELLREWPSEIRCVPGNHDVGDGSGESELDEGLLKAYEHHAGPDHLDAGRTGRHVCEAGRKRLLNRPLRDSLAEVVSGHTLQYLDRMVDGVRPVRMPSALCGGMEARWPMPIEATASARLQ